MIDRTRLSHHHLPVASYQSLGEVPTDSSIYHYVLIILSTHTSVGGSSRPPVYIQCHAMAPSHRSCRGSFSFNTDNANVDGSTYTDKDNIDGPTYTDTYNIDCPTHTVTDNVDGPAYTDADNIDGPTYTDNIDGTTYTDTDNIDGPNNQIQIVASLHIPSVRITIVISSESEGFIAL